MSNSSSVRDEDLSELWRSEMATFDPTKIRRTIDHDRTIQRRTVNFCLAGGFLILLFLIWFESHGVLRIPYLLSTMTAVSLLWQIRVTVRARRAMPDVARLSPEKLLRHAIARAKTTLRNARILYAVNPAAILIGVALGPFLVVSNAELVAATPMAVTLIVALFLLGIAASAYFGVRMARAAQRRITVLEARLKNIAIDL